MDDPGVGFDGTYDAVGHNMTTGADPTDHSWRVDEFLQLGSEISFSAGTIALSRVVSIVTNRRRFNEHTDMQRRR